ncbi:MAG: TIGR03619 family F420-dependent LLM class oxidoreductase [Chloroflexota bacterium]|nr:TIGR03619 family F420-dependent LLM class oxidoreductase [Chloroflexota bacterium]
MSDRIGMGLANFPFSDVDTMWRWIDLCEDNNVDSIWQTDRLISREPILESMTFMAALAARTEKLKFGMNVVVVGFRDPLVLAKQCATIDFLSNGRMLPAFGVGGGFAPEWNVTHRELRGRAPIADEMLDIINGLWNEESFTYHGEHFTYDNATISPKPVQSPLPLWIGGHSKAAIRRTARIGTGWVAGVQSAHEVGPIIQQIRAALAEAGRTDYEPDHFGAGFGYHFGSWDDEDVQMTIKGIKVRLPEVNPDTYFAVGDADEILRRVNDYRAAGVSKFIMRPMARGDDAIMYQSQRLFDEVLPVVHA